MVKIKPQVICVVLDTNVLVPALLFGGKLNRLVARWKSGDIAPVFSRIYDQVNVMGHQATCVNLAAQLSFHSHRLSR